MTGPRSVVQRAHESDRPLDLARAFFCNRRDTLSPGKSLGIRPRAAAQTRRRDDRTARARNRLPSYDKSGRRLHRGRRLRQHRMPLFGRRAHRHKSSCHDWPAHKPRDDQSHGRELRGSAIPADHRGAVRMGWNRRDNLPWRYDRSPCRSRGGLSRHARRRATCARIRKSCATVTFVYAPSGSPSRSIDVSPALSVVSSTTYSFASSALRAQDRDLIVAEDIEASIILRRSAAAISSSSQITTRDLTA